jgi:MOSC domain-containing protein YiiM
VIRETDIPPAIHISTGWKPVPLFQCSMIIRQIFISPGHNYFGHHGKPPDEYPLLEQQRGECVAGHGIRGDRFYDYREDYAGQITLFSADIFEQLCREFGLTNKSPGALRRNVIVSGIDLNSLIGVDFEIQGVQLRGTKHCKPCYWMNHAIAIGAEKWLAGNGGLRAQILSDGFLEIGDARFVRHEPLSSARNLS